MNLFGDVLVNGKLAPFERVERDVSEERFDFLLEKINVRPYYVEDGYFIYSIACGWDGPRATNEIVWHAYAVTVKKDG